MRLFVDLHVGRLSASSQARRRFQRKQAVRGAFARLDAQRALERFQDGRPAVHVAGRAQAHADSELALGLEAERAIERRQPIDLASRNLEPLRHHFQRFARQEIVLLLNLLEDRQAARRSAP